MTEDNSHVRKSDDCSTARTHIRLSVMPSGNTAEGEAGRSYAEILAQSGFPLSTACGGMGTCGKCRIGFSSDAPEPSLSCRRFLSEGLLNDGWRLRC